jgi:hypothetical protein
VRLLNSVGHLDGSKMREEEEKKAIQFEYFSSDFVLEEEEMKEGKNEGEEVVEIFDDVRENLPHES